MTERVSSAADLYAGPPMSDDEWDAFSDRGRDILRVVGDHWPQIWVDQSDTSWLECSCGWDSTKRGAPDWHQHIENAVKQALAP